ncbi:hypothetical protein [Flaviaesturariibacter terrae]
MDIEDIIREEYAKLSPNLEDYQRIQIISNIIELKKKSSNPNTINSIFSDCRNYVKYSVTAIDSPGFGYFPLHKEKIDKITATLSSTQQINVLEYLGRLLKIHHLDDEINWHKKAIKEKKIDAYLESWSVVDKFRLVRDIATYNLGTLVITVLLLYCLYAIILLPAPTNDFVCFESEFKRYSDNSIANHISNTLLGFTAIDDDEGVKIHAKNIGGVVIMLALKGIVLLLFVKFLLDELKEKLKF